MPEKQRRARHPPSPARQCHSSLAEAVAALLREAPPLRPLTNHDLPPTHVCRFRAPGKRVQHHLQREPFPSNAMA
eukprot:5576080-Pleurochrysis_carterae.AAC.1